MEIVQRHQSGHVACGPSPTSWASRVAPCDACWRVCRRSATARPRPRPGRAAASIIDPFEPILKELLAKYPNLTAERALQELRGRGFSGGYTVVHRRLRLLRPRPAPAAGAAL